MDKKYLVNLKGKDYPVYAGVLNEAHKKDLLGIETKLVQIPTEENGNTAIIKAIVYLQFSGGTIGIKDTKGVKQFEAYGDASPKNVNSIIATALIRMAETRAKGRALRDAVNIGDTLAEEIPEEEPFKGDEFSKDKVVETKEVVADETLDKKEKVEGEQCPFCTNGTFVKNPKTGKVFCDKKCWLKN